MPRPVVPILALPRASSRARSKVRCNGNINAAFSATLSRLGSNFTPCSSIRSISSNKAQGSTTTPLPIIDNLPGRTTPEGSKLSLKTSPSMTKVWPALCPPWKRTTTSARSESQSTILPLPSSPHCEPMTTTFAISARPYSFSMESRPVGRRLIHVCNSSEARRRPLPH